MGLYVHVRSDEGFEEDREGLEFASLDDAIAEARRAAREMVAEIVLQKGRVDGRMFEIADSDGAVLAIVPFKDVIGLD
jgi:predicted enzyme related to lactoylglutathione lyase